MVPFLHCKVYPISVNFLGSRILTGVYVLQLDMSAISDVYIRVDCKGSVATVSIGMVGLRSRFNAKACGVLDGLFCAIFLAQCLLELLLRKYWNS